MLNFFIVRGLPGSGRSTFLAGLLNPHDRAVSLSADPKVTGEAFADPLCRAVAQQTAYIEIDWLLEAPGRTPAIGLEGSWADAGGMKVFVELAKRRSAQVTIAEPQTIWARNPAKCARMSTHEPPLPWMRQLAAQWQEVAGIEQILASQSPSDRRQACFREIASMLGSPNPEVAARREAEILAKYPAEARMHGVGEGLEWKPMPVAPAEPLALASLAPRYSNASVPAPIIRPTRPLPMHLPGQDIGGPSIG